MIKVVYITFPNKAEAEGICNQLLDKRLIACSNIYPMQSAYHWQGNIARDDEWVAICKTATDKIPALVKMVETKHSYEVPCIVYWTSEANEAYANWVLAETR